MKRIREIQWSRVIKTAIIVIPALITVAALKLRRPRPAYLKFAQESREQLIARTYEL